MMRRLPLKNNNCIGKLIVFEGTDGAGKTTMISFAQKLLEKQYGSERVVVVKQPTDMARKTKLFQKMMYCAHHEDVDYRAVQLLTMSDRIQHSFETIIPALEQRKIVLCDRYIFTSLANMLARGYRDETWFYKIARHIIRPDITFLAYVDPAIAIERIKNRPEECNRYLDEQLLGNVAKEFFDMAKREGFTVLDTSQEPIKAFISIELKLGQEGLIC